MFSINVKGLRGAHAAIVCNSRNNGINRVHGIPSDTVYYSVLLLTT